MEFNLWKNIEQLREKAPLVHNITNLVVMNNTANALLAAGASPIMAHAHEEVEEMTSLCQSLLINIGTLDPYKVESMLLSAKKANQLGKPWVLDPVGAGASAYRDTVLSQLLELRPTIIRGNASEILSLAQKNTQISKGVDSTAESQEAVAAAEELHALTAAVVCISGAVDIVVYAHQKAYISNGDARMTKVTGLGCSASAVLAAFAAVIPNAFEATVTGTAYFSLCGELASARSAGPGSLQCNLLDVLYTLEEDVFKDKLKLII